MTLDVSRAGAPWAAGVFILTAAGAAAQEADTATTEAAAALISGPAELLWTGFAGFLLIAILMFVLLLRGRVGARPERSAAAKQETRTDGAGASAGKAEKRKPAKKPKKARKDAPPADFFEPAGEDAEITFDDDPPARLRSRSQTSPAATPRGRAADEGDLVLRSEDEAEVVISTADAPSSETPAPRAGAFAGLFAKKDRAPPDPPGGARAHPLASERNRTLEPEAALAPAAESSARGDERKRVLAEAEEARLLSQRLAEQARADAEEETRRKSLEEARLAAERDAADRARRAERDAREQKEREEEFERRKLAAAIEQRERARRAEAVAAWAPSPAAFAPPRRDVAPGEDRRPPETGRDAAPRPSAEATNASALAALARDIDRRLAAIDARVEARSPAHPTLGDASAIADAVARGIAEHRESINASLAAVMNRLDGLAGAAAEVNALRRELSGLKSALGERWAPSAPQVQLEDIVRAALPPETVEMRATLPNNRRADCVLRLPHPPGPIAVDARFPVEAFHALAAASEADRQAAENDFRRTALRHVVDVAERLIVPGATADSALLFIPSETMYAHLHEKFADIVQDAYRAHVWIVSPTTLMATLHTVRAVMREAGTSAARAFTGGEADRFHAEIDALRRRVSRLEGDFTPSAPADAGAMSAHEAPTSDPARRLFDDLPPHEFSSNDAAAAVVPEADEDPAPAPAFPLR